jgi:hypothetical protein
MAVQVSSSTTEIWSTFDGSLLHRLISPAIDPIDHLASIPHSMLALPNNHLLVHNGRLAHGKSVRLSQLNTNDIETILCALLAS